MIILTAILLIAVILIFFLSALPKGKELSVGKLRNVYLYLVSFVTLMMILGGLIFTVQNIMDVIYPTNYYDTYPVEKGGAMTAEEKEKYEENQKLNQQNRLNENKKNVAKSIAVVAVALPTFIYHWRKIEKEKKELA